MGTRTFSLTGKVFALMESIYRTNGTNQAIYIMGLLIQNIVELGAPYNRTLLKEMPVKLVC